MQKGKLLLTAVAAVLLLPILLLPAARVFASQLDKLIAQVMMINLQD
jgi:hypothetical protein